MTRFTTYAALILMGGLSLVSGATLAQQRPPEPDFAKAAAALHVSESALRSCLGPRPEPGQRPERPDATKVAACLSDAGHDVTRKDADAALKTIAPPPRK
ncbi:hypothetical protein E4Z66_08965 [Aliishimia ponticola]|uniref:Secreted protein n=1 Tax=Aliishimia ponticola TaxID=2499833 RepID=A0A4S4NCF5_9RHOB|nr:hypothetical protein [Aliishimia ponticola]THH37059.1 hypothetical protein E4Z66_08965 [Aliishimia ponticola]